MPTYRQQKFDGISIDRQEARFQGAFDVLDEDGNEVLMDAYVLCVTVAKCGPSTIKPMKDGDRVRSDVFKVQDARIVVDEDLRDVLVDRLGLIWPEKLGLEEIDEHLGKKRQADVVTGEIDTPEEEPEEEEPEPEPEPAKKATKAKKAAKKAAAKAKEEEEPAEEDDDDTWEMPPPPRSGVVGDAEHPARVDRVPPDQVFSPGNSPAGAHELVGVIRSSGPGDPLLERFLQEDG